MDISCNGAKMYLVIFVFLICVVDSIIIKVSLDVVDVRVFCCLCIVCVYVCSAGYVDLPIVLLYLL